MRPPCQSQSLGQGLGDRLFEIDVLAGRDCGAGAFRPAAGGAGVEVDRDPRIGKAGIPLGAPIQATVRRRQGGEPCRVAAEQKRIGDEAVTVVERQPAFGADRHQRAQMLGRAEPPRSTFDDDADRARVHVLTPF